MNKIKNIFFISVLVFFVYISTFSGCEDFNSGSRGSDGGEEGSFTETGEGDTVSDKFTISGTITFPGDPTGRILYLYIDNNDNPDDGHIEVENVLLTSDTSYEYSIIVENSGTYYLYGFVDINGSGAGSGICDGDFLLETGSPVIVNSENIENVDFILVLNGNDITAPEYISSTIEDQIKDQVMVEFSENITNSGLGFSIEIDGSPVVITGVSGSGTRIITFTIDREVDFGNVVSITYDSSGCAVDMATTPNFLASFTEIVTNNVGIVCEELIMDGNYNITDEQSLQALAGYTEINGNLIILDTTLANLNGLECLSIISGDLIIGYYNHGNSNLTNIDGLINLTSIGGDLSVTCNDALTNLNGLSNLSFLNGYLFINENDALEDIDSLSKLTSVQGDLYIFSNDSLTTIDGFINLTTILGDLSVTYNDALANIDGLSELTSIGGYLHILLNNTLTNIDGLSRLISVQGNLIITYNNALENIDGLCNLTSIGDRLEIYSNPRLSSCTSDNFVQQIFDNGWDGTTLIYDNNGTGSCD